ncbi:MAG TPA: type II toxin-antitoxin system HicB family antitoxin [Bacteroidota bacterium]
MARKTTSSVLDFTIVLQEEPEGGYTVIVPALPGCVSFGETVDEARRMAKEAIELHIEGLLEKGWITQKQLKSRIEFVTHVQATVG